MGFKQTTAHRYGTGSYHQIGLVRGQFGNVPEHAYALLGLGRCLLALAKPAAEQPLRQAAELFGSMGYRPALSETNALLEQTTAAAS